MSTRLIEFIIFKTNVYYSRLIFHIYVFAFVLVSNSVVTTKSSKKVACVLDMITAYLCEVLSEIGVTHTDTHYHSFTILLGILFSVVIFLLSSLLLVDSLQHFLHLQVCIKINQLFTNIGNHLHLLHKHLIKVVHIFFNV